MPELEFWAIFPWLLHDLVVSPKLHSILKLSYVPAHKVSFSVLIGLIGSQPVPCDFAKTLRFCCASPTLLDRWWRPHLLPHDSLLCKITKSCLIAMIPGCSIAMEWSGKELALSKGFSKYCSSWGNRVCAQVLIYQLHGALSEYQFSFSVGHHLF